MIVDDLDAGHGNTIHLEDDKLSLFIVGILAIETTLI